MPGPRSERHRPPRDHRRVVIEGVSPEIDAGRFPIKRTIGEQVVVQADIFADGHDTLAARLQYRPTTGDGTASGDTAWGETPMEPVGNDRWTAMFSVMQLGTYEYTIEAWVDRFASWRDALAKNWDARQDVATDLLEGAALLREAAERADPARRPHRRAKAGRTDPMPRSTDTDRLRTRADQLASPRDIEARVTLALEPALAELVARHPDRTIATRNRRTLQVVVDRARARFGAWYEMFPRSAGPDPGRSATLREAEARLPAIAGMGFDVLYLPPIHPIGHTFRKGPGNRLTARPGDPGSPWAIGSEAGGHMAVEPSLGTLDDFDHFVEAARQHGLEVALDIAFQCSPDHPYTKDHPEWFRRRPDGTIKYAENPPKKYQDIYPFDFESSDWRGLWHELRDVFRFWIGHGVRIFRVDNPHTKTFGFWEWVIAQVKCEHPDTIFLSEAFTRPKVMRHLAKMGFTQSYTYFTWRNTKRELTEYFTELAHTETREYLRPNLFTNTPDILHAYLQHGGRAAFQVRLVLAATLGASYGIYSSFEICEGRAVPGTEEYLDSEKYQIRHWNWNRPDNIIDLVTRVNAIRRDNMALQFQEGLRFLSTDNDQLLCYCRTSPDGENVILVAVNLDPHHMQHGRVSVPLDDLGLHEGDTFFVHDLLTNERYAWRGMSNYVRLDPAVLPAHILRLDRA